VSIFSCLEFVCTSFHHTFATLPQPSHSAPPASQSDPSCWRFLGVWPFGQRLVDVVGFSWGFRLLASLRVVHSSPTDQRCALCPYCPCSAYLVDGRSLTLFILLRIGSLGVVPSYLAYVCPFTPAFSFSPLYNTVVCKI